MNGTLALDGSGKRLELGNGYALRAPGLAGTARVHGPPTQGTRGPGGLTSALDDALTAAHLAQVRTIELEVRAVPVTAREMPLRDAAGEDALVLETPDLGETVEQIVLTVDEYGIATWHFAERATGPAGGPTVRGAGGVKRFVIRRAIAPPPTEKGARTRSFISVLGRKLLKVLVYPVTDPILGPVSEAFALQWEKAKHPYGLRLMRPESYGSKEVPALAGEDWPKLRQGRALLFIHGTFSTAHGAFNQLTPASMAALDARYGGRLFAFNHFTMAHDPITNVRWLLGEMPSDGGPLEVDVICHSRGGLVTRLLTEPPPELQALVREKITVRRVILVGVPNAGTVLVQPNHMVGMIDRFTTILNVLPAGNVAELLESILALVKIVGHGALHGLDGLASMRPDGLFLRRLNASPRAQAEYFGITADYAPSDEALRVFLKKKLADALIDRLFEQHANDLVVPTRGVFEVEGSPNFPLPPERLLTFESDAAVTHTSYFAHPRTVQAISEWLA